MQDFMDSHLSDLLAAYRKLYSCSNVLSRCVETWKYHLDQSELVGCVLMDLSKAFDSLPHGLLIAKLHAYGFAYKACDFIFSYLKNRKQRVKLGSTRSEWKTLQRGVPQGSLTGPMLFNFFINDLVLLLNDDCDIFNYADDNSLSCYDKNSLSLKCKLEHACEVAIDWFDANLMKANPEKFQAIVLPGHKSQDICFDIRGHEIIPEKVVKLLGVYLDNSLSFDDHISHLCKNAAKQTGALRRLAPLLNLNIKSKIYDAFLLSNFRYCSTVWYECGITNRLKLEKAHKRMLRVISYKDILSRYNKCTIFVMNRKTVIEFVFKVLHDEAPPVESSFYKIQKNAL